MTKKNATKPTDEELCAEWEKKRLLLDQGFNVELDEAEKIFILEECERSPFRGDVLDSAKQRQWEESRALTERLARMSGGRLTAHEMPPTQTCKCADAALSFSGALRVEIMPLTLLAMLFNTVDTALLVGWDGQARLTFENNDVWKDSRADVSRYFVSPKLELLAIGEELNTDERFDEVYQRAVALMQSGLGVTRLGVLKNDAPRIGDSVLLELQAVTAADPRQTRKLAALLTLADRLDIEPLEAGLRLVLGFYRI